MKIYKYDKITKEYLGYMEAYTDPLETIKQGKDVYVIPPNFTTIKPNKPEEGKTVIFDKDVWVAIEDNRGLKVYDKKSGDEFIITELGPIPSAYSIQKPVFLKDLRAETIILINNEYNTERLKEFTINGIKGSVQSLPELNKALMNFGLFDTINITQGDEDIQVTKEELEEEIKYFYIRSMLIPKRKKELLKEINSYRSKSKFQEFVPDFNIDKEVNKLMKLSIEEINEEFRK